MDYVTAKIMLGGDTGQVLHRGLDRPVSWPEVAVIQYLHGEESVFDCEFVHEEKSSAVAEKMRLISIYGEEPVNLVYPGRRPQMDGKFPGDRTPEANRKVEKKLPPTKVAPRQDVEV